jgi:pyruvate kinase
MGKDGYNSNYVNHPGGTVTDVTHQQAALRWRRTKIIATLGPASNTKKRIEQLLAAGVDVVRLNMSHGDHAGHRALVTKVRAAAKKAGRHIAILMDLCGPKIRVGRFEEGAMALQTGQVVTITSRSVLGGNGVISSQYRQLHKDVEPGQRVLLDDGNLELAVLAVEDTEVQAKVIHGGVLKDNKGMNLPDSDLSTSAFTAKDKRDAQLAVELGVDFVALSFVRSGRDVTRLTRFLQTHGADIPIISKIERPEAVENIDDILAKSYGIMIARGDLGIELPAERVPQIQRDLINRARQAHVPVIVATQMLESMMDHSRPTRAEVGDVANAAQSGTDAVMLSGETASGRYPVAAVEIMDRVLRETERHQWQERHFGDPVFSNRRRADFTIREAMSHAALELARDLHLQAIIIPTSSGTTARVVAAHRPTAPMVGVCSEGEICRRLALHWGIVPVLERHDVHDWRRLCADIEPLCGLTCKGHTVLIVSGFNDDPKLNEPVLKVLLV